MLKPSIRHLAFEVLSDHWFILKKYTFEYLTQKGIWESQMRESYDHGNGAAILLYNPDTKNIVLTRQFRLPTYINGNEDGMLIEVCAGLLEGDDPEVCIKKEVIEETGYKIDVVEKVFEAYMSPGSLTELLHAFVGRYQEGDRKFSGGGLEAEQEEIEVLEMHIDQALAMIKNGAIKDAKTIMLIQYVCLHKII